MDKIRTRYAPSPTGRMHVGNLRTALYEYLIAKHEGGDFVLRIEDTDQERFVEGATEIIYRTIAKCGMVYDEGPDKDGCVGPYVQSERLAAGIYLKYAKELIEKGFPKNTAVISFYTPKNKRDYEERRMNYNDICDKVFYVGILDIDIEILSDYGYTYDTYLAEANDLAKFIYEARADGLDILCQCDYGQSRSAACAAAILQHFEGRGIDIFTDYRYYPNQLVYHKVFDALEKQKE